MNGRDFLVVARRLATGSDEAGWRSAVSRAYYAAFHVGCELLAGRRFQVPRADRAHNFVYVRFNNCGDPALVKAASVLFDLRGAETGPITTSAHGSPQTLPPRPLAMRNSFSEPWTASRLPRSHRLPMP